MQRSKSFALTITKKAEMNFSAFSIFSNTFAICTHYLPLFQSQSFSWSSTRPAACRKEKTATGPVNLKPRFLRSRQSLAPLMPISGLLSMEKPSSMMFQITVKHQLKQPYLRHYPRTSKNVVLSSPDQSQFYPFYRLQVWLMTMRMIVNGKAVSSEYR